MTPVHESPGPSTGARRKIYSVTDLTHSIKESLEDRFGAVWVEGEISNLRQPASGHCYFTLKDERAQLSAVLFRGNQRDLPFRLEDGLKVRAHGEVTVYEARGAYQIIVRRMEDAGKGELLEQFEKLKKRLADEGLFETSRKRPLPLLPQHIGVVTSSTGAAIRDILQVLSRRYPNLHIILAPVKVQGEGAAEEIAGAIRNLNDHGVAQVLIVGRGGGSLEDLWAFNEEIVARAVADSSLPVISAVGHEIDFTICDFVADKRAATPSAAAEVVVGRKEDFEAALRQLRMRLTGALKSRHLTLRNRVTAASHSYVFREPQRLVTQFRDRLRGDLLSIQRTLQDTFREQQQRVDELGLRMVHRVEARSESARHTVHRLADQLRALSPLAVLDRGYSITRGQDGSVVTTLENVTPGDVLETTVARGRIQSTVTEIKPEQDHDSKKEDL